MVSTALLSAIVFALQVFSASALRLPDIARSTAAASNLVRAPVSKKIKQENLKGVATHDQSRARALVQRVSGGKFKGDSQVVGVEIANLATTYIAAVDVGSPPTTFFLIVDTGSSNTWVGATEPFTETETTVPLNASVGVTYGSGFFEGHQVLDLVALGGPLNIENQSIGVAEIQQGFDGLDGIIGIGPVGLTAGTVDGQDTVPTVTDNLFSAGIIPDPVVSVFFAPTNSTFDVNGELVFGGIDTGAFTGDLTVVPVTNTFPASEFFGIDISVNFKGTTILTSSGIVDTGTTLLLLASDAFAAYQRATGAVQDRNTGLLRLTRQQFASLPPLNFVIGGTTFSLSADGQRWPQQLNTAIGGSTNFVYLIVSSLGSPSGSGFDFVLGQFFLERFFSVFDSSGFVGLAPTVFTNATVNN
ncbi:aspartic peptidase A1 [Auricularia subglabra TFB-10046 SS5]|uniref:Aspartic peptidase A1 n=1 Tax=Auricularia subglabra (strain TFB-10046 / SS5) TaxID=717982 RepID=J0WX69_AURST|nr:aspartic peptidase A1 [Auricularia subglabra TFB-10046 SS5]